MHIQWFPGHMTKALRMMQENVKLVDVVGYVLDARAPFSCLNPAFEKLIENKPCVFILNKCDLADQEKLKLWKEYFERKSTCVCVSATTSSEAGKIASGFATLTKDLNAKYKAKGVFKPVRAIVIGVPNCGKSTIINCLSGRKTTVTGDKPGVTKGKQWVRLGGNIELLDTPGTVWSKFEDQTVAQRLCFIGSIKDDVVDVTEVAFALIEELKNSYPDLLAKRYGLTTLDLSTEEIHREIAVKRGMIVKGGEVDIERCSKAIIDDFRKGKIGKITFEVPDVD